MTAGNASARRALQPGLSWAVPAVNDLTRTRLVQYAGASGDFNPLHTDEVYAVEVAGHPSVFAHGMLTMAVSARPLTDEFGHEGLARFGGRFRQLVWPGDDLIVTVTVVDVDAVEDGEVARLSVSTSNQAGSIVFEGEAQVHRSS